MVAPGTRAALNGAFALWEGILMTHEQRELLDHLFAEASALAPEQYTSFLAANCPDPEVRSELQSVLQFVTETPPRQVSEAIAEAAASIVDAGILGQRVGPYRIDGRIGQGGMGAVYRGSRADEQFQHTVAIKILRFAQGDSAEVQRFRQERQILAKLEHPHIARLLGGGSWIPPGAAEGQPYIVMEYVDGMPLTAYSERNALSIRARLLLFRQICDAVSYAHRHLVIHRDLKPGNILVTPDGTPRLLDFGIAKLLSGGTHEDTTATSALLRPMTPDYASPEQVRGEPVSTASDVYSLGALLYELLAGRRPHRISGSDPLEIVRTICESEVEPPSHSGNRELLGDLDVIVLKAMQVESARRYGSVDQLSEDLRRYLEGLPILARPDTWRYRTAKFARRHRLGLGAAATVLLALIGGVAGSTWEAARANLAEHAAIRERDRATTAERAAERERDSAVHAERIATTERNRAVAEQQRADVEAAAAKAVNDFLQTDLLSQAGSAAQALSAKPDPDLRVRTALDRAAARLARKFEKQPLVEGSIRQTIADAYKDLGLFPEAEREQKQVLEMRRRVLGPEHPATLDAANRLGNVYWSQGKLGETEQFLTKILETEQRVLGPDHPQTLKTLGNLGQIFCDDSKYQQAESFLTKAMYRDRRVLGEENIDTVDVTIGLARLYNEQRRFADAEELYARALKVLRRLRSDDHPDTLSTVNNLGTLYWREGKFAKATPLFLELSEHVRRALGEEHPDTLTTIQNLASLYRSEGRYAEAEALFSRVLSIRRRVQGEEHRETLKLMTDLASLHRVRGDYGEAERLFATVWEVEHRVLGERDAEFLRTSNSLAVLYSRQGRYTEAETLLAKVLDGRRQILGDKDIRIAQTLAAMGRVRLDQHKYADAEPPLHTALTTFEKAAPDDWERFSIESMLGASLAGQQKYPDAEPLLLEGYAGLQQRERRMLFEHRSVVRESAEAVVQLYENWAKPEQAAAWRHKIQTATSTEATPPR
jgi:tetratricopeptide (TPR) repeat protein